MAKKRTIQTTEEQIEILENKFKIVSGLNWDLTHFPIKKENSLEFKTDRDKSREYAEVFTPLHIVDEMIQTIPKGGMTPDTKNMDLCSGFGQFSIRMIRKLYKDNRDFCLNKYLRNNHFFNELQISSCYKLFWIFGTDINLFIGDALKLRTEAVTGIWYYLDSWINITKSVKNLWAVYKNGSHYNIEKEKRFVRAFKSFTDKLKYTYEEYDRI